jgi:PhnB protein
MRWSEFETGAGHLGAPWTGPTWSGGQDLAASSVTIGSDHHSGEFWTDEASDQRLDPNSPPGGSMAFHPYLLFSGNCREAFTRYHEVFGGELEIMAMSDMPEGAGDVPPEQADLVMHAALTIGDALLMASDDPTGDGGPVKGMSVSVSVADVAEAERVFKELSDGGEVTMPIGETFWSPMFGMCVDRFGTPWMVNAEPAEQ